SLIMLVGGLIGVFFIIALRRPLCVDANLPWPESVASAEIVKAGQQSGDAPRLIFGSLLFGVVMQVLKSDKGLQIMREYLEGVLKIAPVTISWSTPSLSPALIGIGYIIGFRASAVNVSGGIIAWWLLIPIVMMNAAPGADASETWRTVVRPIAVGAMLV